MHPHLVQRKKEKASSPNYTGTGHSVKQTDHPKVSLISSLAHGIPTQHNKRHLIYTAGFGSSCHPYLFWSHDFFGIDWVLDLSCTFYMWSLIRCSPSFIATLDGSGFFFVAGF
jgi:hypothetical protein